MDKALSELLRHAFLSGFVAARNNPHHEPCSGQKAWAEYEPYAPLLERFMSEFGTALPADGTGAIFDRLRKAMKQSIAGKIS